MVIFETVFVQSFVFLYYFVGRAVLRQNKSDSVAQLHGFHFTSPKLNTVKKKEE